MKTERRHDLETNALAKRLAVVVERIKPYTTAIIAGVLTIVAAVLVMMFISSTRAESRQQAWEKYWVATSSIIPDWDELSAAADEHPDSQMYWWAKLVWADAKLNDGTRMFFSEPDAANTALDQAKEQFEKIRNANDAPAALKDRANLGLARVLETNGQVDQAIDAYKQVRGEFTEFAKQRAEQLSNERAQQDATWLASADPPERPAATGPGTPGLRPPFGSDFSLMPDVPSRTPIDLSTGGDPLIDPLSPSNGAVGQPGATGQGGSTFDLDNPFDTPVDPNRYSEDGDQADDQQPE